jgi:hypothetical protein
MIWIYFWMKSQRSLGSHWSFADTAGHRVWAASVKDDEVEKMTRLIWSPSWGCLDCATFANVLSSHHPNAGGQSDRFLRRALNARGLFDQKKLVCQGFSDSFHRWLFILLRPVFRVSSSRVVMVEVTSHSAADRLQGSSGNKGCHICHKRLLTLFFRSLANHKDIYNFTIITKHVTRRSKNRGVLAICCLSWPIHWINQVV